MVLNAIRFLLSSLIANMATILINFQQKFALVRSFQNFAITFLNQKRFLACLKSASKFWLSLKYELRNDLLMYKIVKIYRQKLQPTKAV